MGKAGGKLLTDYFLENIKWLPFLFHFTLLCFITHFLWSILQVFFYKFHSSQFYLCVNHSFIIPFTLNEDGKEYVCNAEDPGLIPCQEDPLEKERATHPSILLWRIPRTEEPGGLQSLGSQRVRNN